MDLMQIFTLVTGVLYIIFEILQKNFMWVVGIATSLAAMWVFFREGLFASFGLNTYYFITSFVGLWHWRRDKKRLESVSGNDAGCGDDGSGRGSPASGSGDGSFCADCSSASAGFVRTEGGEAAHGDVIVLNRLSLRTVLVSLLVTVLGSVLLSRGMTYFHEVGVLAENPMSLLDSVTAVLSAVATWWLVKSYRAQWWLWIVADALSVTLCAMQGMWPMALLYVVYVASAVYGLSYWKKHGVYLE